MMEAFVHFFSCPWIVSGLSWVDFFFLMISRHGLEIVLSFLQLLHIQTALTPLTCAVCAVLLLQTLKQELRPLCSHSELPQSKDPVLAPLQSPMEYLQLPKERLGHIRHPLTYVGTRRWVMGFLVRRFRPFFQNQSNRGLKWHVNWDLQLKALPKNIQQWNTVSFLCQ